MEQFQRDILLNFYNNGLDRKTLDDFFKSNMPLNGAVVITKITKKLKEFMEKYDKDVPLNGYVIDYCPFDEIETNEPGEFSSSVYSKTLEIYKSLSNEDKQRYYMVLLELPSDNDPSNCQRKLLFTNGLNIKSF